jgi:hypothetical protein
MYENIEINATHYSSDRYSRRSSDTGSVFGKYKIPQGGLFRWLSCPNLVGEMIEWIGFAIAGRSPANGETCRVLVLCGVCYVSCVYTCYCRAQSGQQWVRPVVRFS